MERHKTVARTFAGNRHLGMEWECIEVLNTDESTWLIFIRDQEHSAQWKTVKVVADGVVTRKANYWTAWNGTKVARSRDMGIMEEGRPDLYQQVVAFFTRNPKIS